MRSSIWTRQRVPWLLQSTATLRAGTVPPHQPRHREDVVPGSVSLAGQIDDCSQSGQSKINTIWEVWLQERPQETACGNWG